MARTKTKTKPKPSRGLWPFRRRRREAPFRFDDVLAAEGFAASELPTLGETLKAARHDRGLTLDELADTTRVRRAYLEALEEMRLDALPSRPFAVGYVRAYAQALGLEPDHMVELFKAEEPLVDEKLPNPIGVPDDRDPRVAAFVVGAIFIIAAIAAWNIAQRALTTATPAPTRAADERAYKVLAQAKPQPIELGRPLPAPVESTIPPAYETPGLAKSLGLEPAGAPNETSTTTEDPLAALATLPTTFTPTGKVYEAGPRQTSVVTVQAVKPALLIARGADGSVYFARQLAKGDAYRVPQLAGLTLDVSDPRDFQVFVAGQSKGLLPAQQVLASKLVTPAATVTAPGRAATGSAAPAAAAPASIPPPKTPATKAP